MRDLVEWLCGFIDLQFFENVAHIFTILVKDFTEYGQEGDFV